MKKVILYKNKECIAIKSIFITDSNYTFFVQVETKKVIYLKERNNNGKITYVSLDKLICLFDSYQKPYIFNTKVMLDSFVCTINYKIRKGLITNSEDLLDLINQFEEIIKDPYIKLKTNINETNIFSADAMKEVTNFIKKMEVRYNKPSLSFLLHTKEETEQDIFLSQNWLDDEIVDNKKIIYDSIKKSNEAHKRSPIDFLFNNKVLNIYMVIIIICAVGFAGCLEFFVSFKKEEKKVEQQLDELEEIYLTDQVEEQEEIILNDDDGSISVVVNDDKKNNQRTNIDKLKAINYDTVAWLRINNYGAKKGEPELLVNQPVVQTDRLNYYLNHTFKGEKSDIGTPYASEKSDLNNFSTKNIIIYGHAKKVIFGPIREYAFFGNTWYKNLKNQIIKLETPKYDTYWKAVSIYKTSKSELSGSSSPTKLIFEKGDYIKWAKKMVGKTKHNFNSDSLICSES